MELSVRQTVTALVGIMMLTGCHNNAKEEKRNVVIIR
jgi:outer membrane murein-binding lipoprotein Lpp